MKLERRINWKLLLKFAFVLILLVPLLHFTNRTKSSPQEFIWYEPHINNSDDHTSWFWQNVPTNRVTSLTIQMLGKHYQAQNNYFKGSVVVHRYIGTNHSICVYKSILCNSVSNIYLIADGRGLTNATNKSSFLEISEVIADALKKDVADHSPQSTAHSQ